MQNLESLGSALVQRQVRVINSSHTAPLNIGDICEVRVIRPRGSSSESLGVNPVQSTNSQAIPASGDQNLWWLNYGNVELVDVPVEAAPAKKPRMTKKRIEAIKKADAAIMYIQQYCLTLGFDFSLIPEAKVNELISIFGAKDGTKSAVNKALFVFFESLPKVEPSKATDFAQLDEVLTVKVDAASTKLIKRFEANLESNKKNIESYNAQVRDYQQAIADYSKHIEQETKSINEMQKAIDKTKAESKTNVPIKDFSQVQKAVEQLKGMVANLVNTSGFYKLHKFDIPIDGDLASLRITFETSEVYIKDTQAAAAFNLGSFLIEWTPYGILKDYRNPAEAEGYSGNYQYIKVLPNKNNTKSSGYYHPHVSNMRVCWGNVQDTVGKALMFNSKYEFNYKPENAFICLRELMRSYNAASPYHSLTKFRLTKDPKFYLTFDQVFVHKGSTVLSYSAEQSGYYYWNANHIDIIKNVHPASVIKYLDADGRAVSPEFTNKHRGVEIKLYGKYYVDTDIQHREFKGKQYIKLADNSYVLCKR